MSTPSARKTILQSIYCLRRRRTALPLSQTKTLDNEVFTQRPSLVQAQKKVVHRPHMNRVRPQLHKSRTIANPLNSGGLLHCVGIREHYATSANRSSASVNFQLNDDEYTFANRNSLSHQSNTIDASSSNKYESDLVVVLDLDECLVHSQFLSSEIEYRQHEDRPQAQAFRNDDEPESIFASACESFCMSLPDGDLVHVNKRPHLDTFLQEVTSRYETHIFTVSHLCSQ